MAEKQGQSLGDVIREARVAAKKGLREFARDLDIAPSYLSDIENDRRVPAEEILRKIADLLKLDFDNLMALAGRIGEDTERYLKRHPAAGALLRQIESQNIGEDDLKKLSKQAEKMGDYKDKEGGK